MAKTTLQEQVVNQLQTREAKLRASRYAFQTEGRVALVQFDDGPERWTAFKHDHEFSRLEIRGFEAVREEAEEEKESRRLGLPDFLRRSGVDEKAIEVQALHEAAAS